ncbi:uncharacterized protein LOC135930941 [Gordionus sp. m RMFG-2023]|uniref:uncharacterized protein LOC135930941 n=1 Tax=Gordionus sp. m RMFG-2023 TaxID=3053472 RepID=UPI0031FC345B
MCQLSLGLPNHGQPAPYRLTQSQSESHGQYFNDHGGVGTKNNSNIDSHYNYQLPNKHTYNKCPFATNDMYRSNILMNHQPPNLPLPNFAEAKPNNHFQTNLRNASRYNCNSGVNRNSPYGQRINGDNDNNNRYYQNRHQQLSSSNPKTRMEARKQQIRQISRYARRGNALPNSKSALSVVDCDSLTNNLLSLDLNSRTNNRYYLDHHQFETESLVTNSTNFRHSSSSSPSNGGSYFAAANRNVVPKTRQPYIPIPQHPNNIHHRHPNDVDNYNFRKSGHHCQPELMYDNDIRETINNRTRDFGTLGAHYKEEGYRDGNIKEEEYIRQDEKEGLNITYLEYQPDRFNRHNTAEFSRDGYDYNSYNGDKRGQPNNPLPYVIPYSSISGTGGGSSATVLSNSVAFDTATGENVPSSRDRYNYHSYNGDKRSQPINSPPFTVPYPSISGPLGTSTVTLFGNCNTHDTVTDENVASSCERYNVNSYENNKKSKPNNHPPCVIPHLGIYGPHGGSFATVLSNSATYDTHTSENLILARTVNDGNEYRDLRSTSGDFLTRRSQDNLQRLEASYVIDAHRSSDGILATPRDYYTPSSTRLGHDPSNHGTVNVLMGKISKLDIDDQKTPRPAKVSLFPPGANFNKSPSLPPSPLPHSSSSSSHQSHHNSDVKKSMGFVVPLDQHPFKNESTSCSVIDTELGISRDEDLDESIIKRKEIIISNVVKRRAEMEASKAKNNAKAVQAREKMMAKQIELEKKREEVKERKQAILINYLEGKRARNNTDVPPHLSKTVLPFNQPSPTHSTSDSKLVSSLTSYGNEEYRLAFKPQLPPPQNQAKNSIKTTSPQLASGSHFNKDAKDKRILGNSASFKGFKSGHRKWLPQEPTAELTRDAEDINSGKGLICRKEIVLVKRSFNRRPLSAAKSQYSLRDIQEEQGNEFETGINLESLQENPFSHTHICPRYQESFKNSNVSLSTTASQKSTTKIFSNNNNINHNRIKNGGLKMSKSINGKNTSHTCSSTSVSSSTSAIAQSATNGSSRINAKPSERSNRNLIIQALSYSVLAGPVNTDVKTRAIEAMNRSLEHKQFIILFRDRQMQYRALYQRTNQPDGLELYKIHGLGPKLIVADQDGIIQYFYKYNCGSKSFMQIPSKQLSATIDGIVLKEFYWINLKLSKK